MSSGKIIEKSKLCKECSESYKIFCEHNYKDEKKDMMAKIEADWLKMSGVTYKIMCKHCNGSGYISSVGECVFCAEKGYVLATAESKECRYCNGDGYSSKYGYASDNEECDECEGYGTTKIKIDKQTS